MLFDDIASYLGVAHIEFQQDGTSENGLLVSEIVGEHGSWRTYIQITDEPENRFVVLHAQFPAGIPVGSRVKLSERLTRINYDLPLGNFELGMDDGELLFKTAIDLADGQLTRQMFWRMYDRNQQVMDQYFAEIAELAFGADAGAILDVCTAPDGAVLQ